MSDVSAVVLTIGEESTDRAIESVRRQRLPAQEIILVENVTPFYKALNLGAAKVKTDFFVQVDADMILDDDCLENLRGSMFPHIGQTAGMLRDPMVGRINCIRMFRTLTFERLQFPNTISPETDFRARLREHGWLPVSVLNFKGIQEDVSHTHGEHRPSYTALYTFSKFLLEGVRLRYRKSRGGLFWRMNLLQKSAHEMALVAQIALAHGIVIEAEEEDNLMPFENSEDSEFLQAFFQSQVESELTMDHAAVLQETDPRMVFETYYRAGIELRHAKARDALRACMNAINNSKTKYAWLAKTAVCHGIFVPEWRAAEFDKAYKMVGELQ